MTSRNEILLASCHPYRNDGSEAEMALNEPHLTLRDRTPVLIHRLVPEDAALYPDFLNEVTAEDLRLRFFAPMREVSPALLDKLIHYDPARAMAFIAVDEQNRKMLGVVRLHNDTGGENAEFAILVRSRLKGHGVGWLLMKHMIEFSKHKNLKTVHGQVLAENTIMLAMCAELGFHIADDPEDPGVKTVTLPVTPPAASTAEHAEESGRDRCGLLQESRDLQRVARRAVTAALRK